MYHFKELGVGSNAKRYTQDDKTLNKQAVLVCIGRVLSKTKTLPQENYPNESRRQSCCEATTLEKEHMNKIKKLISDYEKTRDPFVQIGILGQMLIEIKRLSKEIGKVI